MYNPDFKKRNNYKTHFWSNLRNTIMDYISDIAKIIMHLVKVDNGKALI